jgi:hypothetical protein
MYNFIRPQTGSAPLIMSVLVFRTDLHSRERVDDIGPLLENTDGICRWNVDMHDCDNVLRIEALDLSPRTVEAVVQQAGYFCQELPD